MSSVPDIVAKKVQEDQDKPPKKPWGTTDAVDVKKRIDQEFRENGLPQNAASKPIRTDNN